MEAAELGIDLTMIKVCRRFRHLAKLDRLRIDMTEHRSGLNKHLFGYIEYCGMTSLDFVQRGMRVLPLSMIGFCCKDIFSSISLLIDSLVIQTDANSKQVADFALITFVQSLNLTDNQRRELISLLDDKYRVSSIMAIAAGNLSI